MTKHIGLHNAKKIIIVLHKMPAEEHMCLVLINDKIPPRYYDAVIKALETPEAQNESTKDFAEILEKTLLDDGRNLGQLLYSESHFKKVPTNQVFATPYGYTSSNKIKLNDLNEHLSKIAEGGEALAKLEALDKGRGMNRKKRNGSLTESVKGQNSALVQHSSSASRATVIPSIGAELDPAELFESLKQQTNQLSEVVQTLVKQVEALQKPVRKTSAKKATK